VIVSLLWSRLTAYSINWPRVAAIPQISRTCTVIGGRRELEAGVMLGQFCILWADDTEDALVVWWPFFAPGEGPRSLARASLSRFSCRIPVRYDHVIESYDSGHWLHLAA
jgi:hypothetical protein